MSSSLKLLSPNYLLRSKCDVCNILYKDSSFHFDPSKNMAAIFLIG